MQVLRAIESGEACEAYLPTIAALAGGSASSAEIIEIRPHLRHCSACRATVRQLHVPAGTTIKLLLPGFVLVPLASMQGSTGGAAVAPVGDALDQDQLAVLLEIPERSRRVRLASLRDELLALLHRTNGSDAATGVYIATSGGGGRISTIATIIGFCVSGAGAGALCVATGVVEAPRWILGQPDRAPAPKRSGEASREAAAVPRPSPAAPTATPAPILRPVRFEPPRRKPASSRTSASKDPSQGTTPTSHESPPISKAPAASTSEFGFESSGGSSPSTPAASAPATGGGEFTP